MKKIFIAFLGLLIVTQAAYAVNATRFDSIAVAKALEVAGNVTLAGTNKMTGPLTSSSTAIFNSPATFNATTAFMSTISVLGGVTGDLVVTGRSTLSKPIAAPLGLVIGTGFSPDSSSLLDVSTASKGFLPPRMTGAQRDAISNPTDGLVIYNTNTSALNVYAAGTWTAVGTGGGSTTAVVAPDNYVAITSNYTVANNYNTVDVTSISANTTVALYTAVGNAGRRLTVVKTDASTNKVILDPFSTQTIAGATAAATTRRLSTVSEAVTLESDGANWLVLNHSYGQVPRNFTFTTNFSVVTLNGTYTRVGSQALLDFDITATNDSSGSQLVITLPAALTMDTSMFPTGAGAVAATILGNCLGYDNGTVYHAVLAFGSSTTLIGDAQTTNAALGDLTSSVPFNLDTADSWTCQARIPVTDWW